jgi:class I lanthipeptide synthase
VVRLHALPGIGELAGEARRTVHAIAAALRAPDPAWSSSWRGDYPSLAARDPLIALLFAYLDDEHVDALCDDALAAFARGARSPALHGGFAGLGWMIAHVTASEPDTFVEIDRALAALLEPGARVGHDLVNGLVGFGVYFLERGATAPLAAIAERLWESAEHTPDGMTWRTPASLLPAWQRAVSPEGHHDLGVAHGVPGVIGLCAALTAAGIAGDRAPAMLAGAVEWLLAQRGATGFASWSGAGDAATPAWCYGELGIAVVLLAAAHAAARPEWERVARELAARVASAAPQKLRDTGLCHGSAGVAHLFQRVFEHTGDERFAAAAHAWLAETLRRCRPGDGVAGYGAWTHLDAAGELCWGPDPSFLNGAAGVALALLAAIEPHEPSWDRVLLAALPRRVTLPAA